MTLPLKLALLPLLIAQAMDARRRAPVLPEADGPREGVVGAAAQGDPVRLLIVGDSSAAGVGVDHQDRALAGYLTRTVAERSARRIAWQLKARTGVTTAGALKLVQHDQPAAADVAVAVLGVNDVIEQVSTRRALAERQRLTDWLMEHAGVRHVVFAPLPPVEDLPLLRDPLRSIAGRDARRHDEAVARWAAGRRDVSHVPISIRLDESVLASDGFHPGEPVYRHCGEALGQFIADELVERVAPAARHGRAADHGARRHLND
jgi:lysophospholipase L1-like esterase